MALVRVIKFEADRCVLTSYLRIFILEGILTFVVGLFSYAVLIKFPDQEMVKPSPWFLKSEEAAAILHRLNEDRGDTEVAPFSLIEFLKPCTEIEIWGFALIFL